MTLAELSAFLTHQGLWLLLPLAIVEGPIVAVVAGVLCSQSVFDWFVVYPLLVIGDLIGDCLYYAVGRLSQGRVHRIALWLHLPVSKAEEFAARVKARSIRMLLIGKWTHAIGILVLIAAGAARIALPRFLIINLLATLPKAALLLGVGYLVGANWTRAVNHWGWWTLGLVIVGVLAAYLVLRHPRPRRGQAA